MSSVGAPPLLGHLDEVRKSGEARAFGGLLGGRALLILGIGGADRLVGPAKEQLPVLTRHAEQIGEHRKGNCAETPATKSPSSRAVIGEVVESLAADLLAPTRAVFSRKRGVKRPLMSRRNGRARADPC